MKKAALLTVMSLLLTTIVFNANAQDGLRKKVEMKSTKVASRGSNPNIKGDKPTTDEVSKKGTSRGSGYYNCYMYLHNYTGYTIDVYIDGYYETTIGAYGDATVVTGNGWTSIYGISAGRTMEWSGTGDCQSWYDFSFY